MSDVPRTVIQLQTPVPHGQELVTELAFREPKAKDFRGIAVNMGTWTEVFELAGRLCGQPPVVIDALSVADMMRVSDLVGGFLLDGRPTSMSSSPSLPTPFTSDPATSSI